MLHAIRSALGPVARVGKEITYLPTCPSTNDLLKAMAEAGAGEGTVLVAGEQTRGKGRLGRSFTSAAGKGVYLSALLRPQLPPEKLLPLLGFTAEAMGRAVRRVAGAEAGHLALGVVVALHQDVVPVQLDEGAQVAADGQALAGVDVAVDGHGGLTAGGDGVDDELLAGVHVAAHKDVALAGLQRDGVGLDGAV